MGGQVNQCPSPLFFSTLDMDYSQSGHSDDAVMDSNSPPQSAGPVCRECDCGRRVEKLASEVVAQGIALAGVEEDIAALRRDRKAAVPPLTTPLSHLEKLVAESWVPQFHTCRSSYQISSVVPGIRGFRRWSEPLRR